MFWLQAEKDRALKIETCHECTNAGNVDHGNRQEQIEILSRVLEGDVPCDVAELLVNRKQTKKTVDWIGKSEAHISAKELERCESEDKKRILSMARVVGFHLALQRLQPEIT